MQTINPILTQKYPLPVAVADKDIVKGGQTWLGSTIKRYDYPDGSSHTATIPIDYFHATGDPDNVVFRIRRYHVFDALRQGGYNPREKFLIGAGRPETPEERAQRLEAEKEAARAMYEAKLAAQAGIVRKLRESLERQPGNKREGARREKMACAWLLSIGYISAVRTSPKAPGYDIIAIFSDDKVFQFEVKPKGELVTDKEEEFAIANQDTWRLIEFNPDTQSFRMFNYSQCVWRLKLEKHWRINPYPCEAPLAVSGSFTKEEA